MGTKIRVKTMSMSLGLTLPSATGYGSIKPVFGVEVEVPADVDPEEFRSKVLLPWVRHGLMRLLHRQAKDYVKAEKDLPGCLDEYFKQHPKAPSLTIEAMAKAEG